MLDSSSFFVVERCAKTRLLWRDGDGEHEKEQVAAVHAAIWFGRKTSASEGLGKSFYP
jgi:hypothetical protein